MGRRVRQPCWVVSTLALAYFGNLRTAPSSGSVLDNVPAAPADPVQQIPGSAAPSAAPAATGAAPDAPAAPAPTGAGQIPAK